MASKKAGNTVAFVIVGLLVVGLLGFGLTDFGGGVRTAGSVGRTEVDVNRYAVELRNELRALQAQTGRAVTLSEARQIGLEQTVLQRLLASAALEEETRQLGLSVSDATVGEDILESGAFSGIDGSFDRAAYEDALARVGYSPRDYEERVRADVAIQILQAGLVGGLEMPGSFADTLYDWQFEARDATFAVLTEADLSEPLPDPDEAALQSYLSENEDAFTVGPTRNITYAWITPEMVLETLEVDEDLLREAYEAARDQYVQPERRLVERLVFSDAAAADDALARIEAGETDFTGLVEARGLTLDDVDLGDVSREDLGAAADAVFALGEPGIAGPAETPLGPALFRVNAILAAQETPFEEAEDELRAELAADRAERVIADMFSPVEDLLAGGATVEEVAGETELRLGTIDWREGVSEGIAAYGAFREAAALAEEGDFPEALALEDGGIFTLRLDGIQPAAVPPLDEIRPDVADAWARDEATRRLTALADDIAEEGRSGSLPAFAELTSRKETDITRDATIEDAVAGLVPAIFTMEEGDFRVVSGDGRVALVRLDAVRAPDGESAQALEIKRSLARTTSTSLAADVLQGFVGAVQADEGVEVNQAAINAVAAQFQ